MITWLSCFERKWIVYGNTYCACDNTFVAWSDLFPLTLVFFFIFFTLCCATFRGTVTIWRRYSLPFCKQIGQYKMLMNNPADLPTMHTHKQLFKYSFIWAFGNNCHTRIPKVLIRPTLGLLKFRNRNIDTHFACLLPLLWQQLPFLHEASLEHNWGILQRPPACQVWRWNHIWSD